MTSIGNATFSQCSGLTSVTIGNGVTSIGNYAFEDCKGLTSITIPNSVTGIGDYAFSHCTGLTSITIGNGVTSIGDHAFTNCTGLTSITIGNSVTSINSTAFQICTGLTSIKVETGNTHYDSRENCNAIIETSSNTLVVGCKNTVIPNSVTSIGEMAFAYCTGLTSIIIPNSVTSIGNYAFYGCSSLTDFYCYAEDVPSTGSQVFQFSPIESATLHVPAASVATYSSRSPWSKFGSILPFTFTLTYIVDGDIYKTYDIDYNSPITPEAAPTKEGYTFSGWSEIPETMPNHDVTVTGSFTINSYTLTYMVDGEEYKTSTVVYGTEITPEEEPSKEGYSFSGWSEIPATMPAEDVVITGTFTINSYALTYIVDGEVYKTYEVEYNSPITPEAAPTKEGYTFSGWSEIPETMPAEDVTVTGSFAANSYTLTYIVDGQVYKTYSVACGAAITPEEAPTKEGYTFSGWTYIPTTMPATDVVVMGTFTINSYTLTYMVDGEEYKTSTVVYGSEITPEAEPTKEGYTFSGWSEIPETMPAEDVVVTGTFIVNSYALTYIVDGEEYKTDSIAYGMAITPEDEPTKEGYTFSGWSEIPGTMPAEDVTVTGSFTINQYLLTYIIDGEEYKSYEVDYNTALTPEPAPTKKGMTFSGWSEMPETMPAHDLTLTGTYNWTRETFDGVIYQVTDTLNNYASVVGTEEMSEKITILTDVMIDEYCYTVNSIEDNALPKTATINVSVGRLLLWLWENGYEDIQEIETGRSLSAPEIALVHATASSLTLSYMNEYKELSETVTALGSPIEKGENGYEIALKGLEPDNLYEASVTLSIDDVSYTKSFSFSTEPLTLVALQPKVVSLGNVIVAANSNLDDEETNVGFEWRRIDWTDDFESRTGAAYLYEGIMEGYIRSLNHNYLWKFRPYYTSSAGNTYYSDWKGMDPSDYSYFEPTVHTYAPLAVTDSSADVKGYAMRGTDDVTSQGFKYWITASAPTRRKVKGVPVDATELEVQGHVMTATLEGLDYDTEYCVVAFVKTSSGEIFYGEQQSFRTNSDPDGIKLIDNGQWTMDNEEAWYSLDGKKLSKPQKGLNIIRYSDGTTRKVLIK